MQTTLVRGYLILAVYSAYSLTELNPDPENLPELDPKDEFLLLDLNTSSTAYGAVGAGSASAALQNVSWLRKSDHRERPGAARVTASQEQ